MQWFLDGLVYQAERVKRRVELILVEWNPPADGVSLADILRWPPSDSWLACRVVTVPAAVHKRIMPQIGFGMMQMIAKNVGIRVAAAPWVLATNIDILFPDDVFELMLGTLDHRSLYRADRVDVPFPFPQDLEGNVAKVLDWCRANPLRFELKDGVWIQGAGRVAPIPQSIPDLLVIVTTWLFKWFRYRFLHSGDDSSRRAWEEMEDFRKSQSAPSFYGRTKQHLTTIGGIAVLPKMHINACGDFTLLPKEVWHELRGYPEWPVHSLHVDEVFLYQAFAAGLRDAPIGGSNTIYHMEHSMASGITPEGAKAHLDRIENLGVHTLDSDEVTSLKWRLFLERGRVIRFNDDGWGCSRDELQELTPVG